jgi:predicted dehydrogenase
VLNGRKAGFSEASTQADDVFNSPRINTIVIATRHNTHASLVARGLQAGKHIFVEKPMALTLDEVEIVEKAFDAPTHGLARPLLMVGFNRRFAPLAVKMKSLLDSVHQPKAFSYVCNAGMIPRDHWTQDPAIGGGRILGEACHFIDFLRFLAGAPIRDFHITFMGQATGVASASDKAIISLGFQDGSIGTVQYFANGGKVFPKERLEVFAGGAVLQLDNFSALRGFGWPGFKRQKIWRQDKGHSACAAAFLDAIRNGLSSPIPKEEIFEVARVSIQLAQLQRNA